MTANHVKVIIIIASVIFLAGCCKPPKPVEYTHEKSGFKISAPGDWKLDEEDEEHLVFRKGEYMLIEVGGYKDFDPQPDELREMTEAEFKKVVKEMAQDDMPEYCDDVQLDLHKNTVVEQEMTWDGLPGYRIKGEARDELDDKTMVIDYTLSWDRENNILYMCVIQIPKKNYRKKVKEQMEAVIASFKII